MRTLKVLVLISALVLCFLPPTGIAPATRDLKYQTDVTITPGDYTSHTFWLDEGDKFYVQATLHSGDSVDIYFYKGQRENIESPDYIVTKTLTMSTGATSFDVSIESEGYYTLFIENDDKDEKANLDYAYTRPQYGETGESVSHDEKVSESRSSSFFFIIILLIAFIILIPIVIVIVVVFYIKKREQRPPPYGYPPPYPYQQPPPPYPPPKNY